MTSIVDNLKDAFKYPLYDIKKIGILAILYFIPAGLSLISDYIILDIVKQSVISSSFFKMTILGDLSLKQQATLIPHINLIFLGIIAIISILLGILAYGYLYKIIESTMNGENNLPKINSYKKMIKKGVKITIIGIIYSLIISVLLIINIKIINISAQSNLGVLGLISSTIFAILSIFIIAIELISITNMIKKEGKLSNAFKFSEIFELISKVGKIRTFGAIIISSFASLIISISGIILLIIILILLTYCGVNQQLIQLLIGSIIFALLLSYCSISLSRFYGLVYKDL